MGLMDFFKLDPMFDTRRFKDIYLGLCFFVIFTAFLIFSREQTIITRSIEKDNPSFHLDRNISLGIFYTALALGLWLSSGIIAKTSSKYAMIFGTTFWFLYMVTFCTSQSIWFYLGNAASGFGNSLLWTGLANYIVLNSKIGKVYFGIGVFWIFYEFSNFFGKMIIHFKFDDLDEHQEIQIAKRSLYKLIAIVIFGIVMLIGIKPPLRSKDEKEIVRSPCTEIKKTSKLLITPRMLLLTATMITIGVNSTFTSLLSVRIRYSVYLTRNFENLYLLCSIVQAFGGILGGAFSIAVGGRKIRRLRPLISLALACNLTCYLMTFLALPDGSARFYADDKPIVPLPSWILVIGAALSGMGEAFLHISFYDILGAMYPNESASAFAVFKFIRSIAAAASLYYGFSAGLHVQIVILMVLIVLSWLLYSYVDWLMIKTTSEPENQSEERVL